MILIELTIGPPRLLLTMNITFTNGTRDLIINTARPRFSWKISSADRNLHQIAYQIQIHDEDQQFE